MSLFKNKGIFPYFFLVFFNTFIDIGHKILIQDTLFQTSNGYDYTVYSAIINAFILLPYLLLFTPSGFIADKFAKAKVLRLTAFATLPLTLIVTYCYYQGQFWAAFSLTLLLAVQSALNSPAKYGYMKEAYGKDHLSELNAIVQTITIVAILGATIAFSYFFSRWVRGAGLENSQHAGEILKAFAPVGWLLVLMSCFETMMTLRLSVQPAVDPQAKYQLKKYIKGDYLKSYLRKTRKPSIIFSCIIGLSVYFAVNQVLLASYGAFLKEHVQHVSVLFAQSCLAIAGLGVLLGALIAGRLSRESIETGLIPLACLGIALGLLILPHVTHWLSISTLLFAYGIFGGLLIVPLNALIQFNSPKKDGGKILAGNNFIQNIFMTTFLGLTVASGLLKIDSQYLINSLFIIASCGAVYTLYRLPQSFARVILYAITSRFYRIYTEQLENMPSSGGVLLLGNHVSFIDWAFLLVASPRPVRFVIDRDYYERWYLKGFFKALKLIPIAPGGSKEALKSVNEALNNGEVIALFPEGRLSLNGQMGKFRSGFERSAANAKACIIPFYIHGIWGSKTTYANKDSKKMIQAAAKEVHVVFGEAMPIDSNAEQVKRKVNELSTTAWKNAIAKMDDIPSQWLKKAKSIKKQTALIDMNHQTYRHQDLLTAVLILRKKLKPLLANEQNIGLLLPSGLGSVIANMACLFLGKTVVNLNYSADEDCIRSAIQQAGIKTIISAELFEEKLKGRGLDMNCLSQECRLVYLENIMQVSRFAKIRAFLTAMLLPVFLLKKLYIAKQDIHHTAAILFSSGSEGMPKGIELSHGNILSNIHQMTTILSLSSKDKVLNALPPFHAFGLTVTTLLPLLKGIAMVCHPDPSQTGSLAKLIHRHQVTLLCSTSSLLGLFCRNHRIKDDMLKSIKLVISGAEKLSEQVFLSFKEKFGLEIYEGYGATEASPVISTNLPDIPSFHDKHVHQANRKGTVGLPLPGTSIRIVNPETLEELPTGEEGLILIAGSQVMKGYLNQPDKTGEVLIIDGENHWYKTGDKGRLDKDGFLTIVDRYSRFAKIAGEMLSLSYIESAYKALLDEEEMDLMVVSLPDEKKGEKLAVLISTKMSEHEVRTRLTDSQLSRLMLPAEVCCLDELPRLGSGKKDYHQAKASLMNAVLKIPA